MQIPGSHRTVFVMPPLTRLHRSQEAQSSIPEAWDWTSGPTQIDFPRFTQIEPWNIWFTIDWYTRWYIIWFTNCEFTIDLPLIYPWFTLFTNWDQIENLIQPLADLTKDCRFWPLKNGEAPNSRGNSSTSFWASIAVPKNTPMKFQMDPICKSKKKRSFKHKFYASHSWACYQCYHFWNLANYDSQANYQLLVCRNEPSFGNLSHE